VFTQLNSPVGTFGLSTLALSTRGLASGSATDDGTYTATEKTLTDLGVRRDSLVSQIASLLQDMQFGPSSLDQGRAKQLITQGRTLLKDAMHAAGN
jgi:hypothetical protein